VETWIDNTARASGIQTTDGEIDDYIDANVTDMASARTALKMLGHAILDLLEVDQKEGEVVLAILKKLKYSE